MHGGSLGGPVFWFAFVTLWVTGVVALWVTVDAARRRGGGSFARLAEPWWFYAVPQGAYFVLFVLAQFGIGAGVTVLAAPLVLAQQVMYLLRVAFPAPGSVPGHAPEAEPASGHAEDSAPE